MSAYVEVNECVVFATWRAAGWWADFRRMYEPAGRIQVMQASIGGDRVRVACDDREHAADLAEHMVSFAGLPKSAVRVVVPRVRSKAGDA